jgi:hypothetical protein
MPEKKFPLFNNPERGSAPKITPKQGEPTRQLSRREFLRIGAAGALFAGATGITQMDRVKRWIKRSSESPTDQEALSEPELEPILEEDPQDFDKLLEYNYGKRIAINSESVIKAEAYWRDRYLKDEKLKRSLNQAYQKMGSYQGRLEQIFLKQGVPSKYLYLAIPESHWVLRASSGFAVGPYQFTRKTAQKYGLIRGGRDYRTDPLESGRACAKYLKDLYNKTKDWNLALTGYNAGFIWSYLRGNKNPTYEGFLEFIEEGVNNIKDGIERDREYSYRVRGRDTLGSIGQAFGVDLEVLKESNGITDVDVIQRGQEIKIPFIDNQVKKAVFKYSMQGFVENLNYPAKANAVFRLIQEQYGYQSKLPTPTREEVTQAGTGVGSG